MRAYRLTLSALALALVLMLALSSATCVPLLGTVHDKAIGPTPDTSRVTGIVPQTPGATSASSQTPSATSVTSPTPGTTSVTSPTPGTAGVASPTPGTTQAGQTGVSVPTVSVGMETRQPPQPNLIANGTFENGTLDGWDAVEATASTAESHTGGWSACGTDADMQTAIDTTPGNTYKLTAWIKIARETGSDWGGFRLVATSWDWTELADSGVLLSQAEGSDWFKAAVTFAATTAQTRIHAGYSGGPDRVMHVCIDDVWAFAKSDNSPPHIQATLNPVHVDGAGQVQSYTLTVDDVDGAVANVLWEFGDGTRSLSPSGTRRVTLPGSYAARVLVTDDEGARVEQTLQWSATVSGFPSLVVNTPAAYRSAVDSGTLAASGTSGGPVSAVRVSSDRGYVTAANGTSAWSAKIPLQPGLNRLLFQAHSIDGRIVTVERLVRYEPPGELSVSSLAGPASVERWEVFETTFALQNSAATHPQFPYDPEPPPGLEWVDGVTADVLFTPDDWQTTYRRPAFLNQRYQRALKGGEEWLYPSGNPVWTVRFAPPQTGTWRYRVEVREARGVAQSDERTFLVTPPTGPNNHGPLQVSTQDSRYFEFADGTPFLGTGHEIGFPDEGFSYAATELFDQIGQGNQSFFRWWIAGQIWASAWQPWASLTLDYEGNVPATGLTVDRAYGEGLAALKLDAQNPLMFQGHMSGHASLIPGRTYRILVRWRTEDVRGPEVPGQPYGITVKLTDWPKPGQTGSIPAVIPHVHGDTPWHVAQGDWVAQQDLLPNLALILENTTAGAAYVDEVSLYEVLSDGSLGPQLLRTPRFNSYLTFDPRRGAGMDAILAEAAQRGLYLKLVISEKQEYLLNHIAPDGLPDRHEGNFDAGDGSPSKRLHQYYWRHLLARFGAYRSVHSWELVNEAAPGPGDHFRLTASLAAMAATDGNPHLATTSTWATLAEEAWKDPASAPISYVDFHAYVRGTGWIEPREELANDSARFFHEYDMAALGARFGKPVVWGEQGIDSYQGTDDEDPGLADDRDGIWLHKLTWARCGPGGVYPVYWYTDLIFGDDSSSRQPLHAVFGAWNRFMAGIPLANGRYRDVAAVPSRSDLRVLGQRDTQAGQAYAWIDNANHTWRAVVDGVSIPALSGTVRIPMERPNASFVIVWYDTSSGAQTHTETLVADEGGTLTLSLSQLATDIAVKIAPAG